MRASEMLILVLCIDAMLLLVNVAVFDINGTNFYEYDGSVLKNADAGDGTYVLRELSEEDIPSATQSVDTETGGLFTDIFRSVRNWLFENIPGAQTVTMAINAVPNFLAAIGLPQIAVFTLGAVWHLFGIFTLVSFIWGRE